MRVEEAVDVTLRTDESEEWNLEKVHRDVELEHVGGKDGVGIVENYNGEYPAGGWREGGKEGVRRRRGK